METMTIENVLRATVKLLEGIKIPVSMSEEVGVPVLRSIGNLNACVSAIEKSREEAQVKAEEEKKEAEPQQEG